MPLSPAKVPWGFSGGWGWRTSESNEYVGGLGNRMWWARVRFEETIEYYRGSANVRVLTSVI